MKYNTSILTWLVLISCGSCATLLTQESQKVYIDQDSTTNLMILNNYSYNRNHPDALIPVGYKNDYLYFQRSKSPIILIDSIVGDTTSIYPHKSYFLYWFGNIYTTLGLGMIIDNRSNKRFQYRKYNYFTRYETEIKNIRFNPTNARKLRITIGIPYINHFHLFTDNAKVFRTGFWGISFGAEYYLNPNSYISSTLNLATDYIVPFPVGIDYEGEWESSSTVFGNLRFNKSTPYFEYGAGLSVAHLNWNTRSQGIHDSTYVFVPRSKSSINIGLSTSVYYRFSPRFKTGLLYQPYLYSINNGLQYQHFVSIEFQWRL